MKTKKQLLSRQRVPIGARLLGRLKPLGKMRLWLLVMLMGWSSSAFSWYLEEFNNFRTTVDINGNLHYKFDMRFWVSDYDTDYYRWDGDVWLKIDGNDLCKLNEVSPVIGGTPDFSFNSSWYNELLDLSKGNWRTKRYNIVNVTYVYVSIGNLHASSTNDKDIYLECDVCFERNYMGKSWDIGIYGFWHYNKNDGRGRWVNKTIFTTNTPSAVTPSISSSNFKRSNKKIDFTYPAITTNYSGWSNQVVLYKEDVSNRWQSESSGWGTFTGNSSFNVSDNYTPVTIYPRFEFYKSNATINVFGDANAVRFDKDYGAITIPGQPRPTNIQISAANTYSKEVTLQWEREAYDNTTATDGKWVIFRKVTGQPDTQVKLGEVPNGTYSYSDKTGNLNYGTTYTYTVCYQPKGWTIEHESEADGLNGYVRYKLNRDFAFSNLNAEAKDGKITFSWSHNGIQDAGGSKTYTLEVQRSADNGKTFNTVQTIPISSPSVTTGSYTDADVVAHQPYQYRLKINVQEQDVYSAVKTVTITSGSYLTGFSASRGNYTTSVKLSWTVKQVGTEPAYFTLQRRPLGSTNESLWADIYTTSGTASNYSYDDNTAQPGSFNEYRLKIFDIYEGTRYEGGSKEIDGFCIATGVVSGRITFGSGTAVEGAKITLSPTNADGDVVKSNRSLKLDGSTGQGLKCNMSQEELKSIFDGDFTIQMWVNPDTLNNMSSGANKMLFDVQNTFSIYLMKTDDGKFLIKNWIDGNNRWQNANKIPACQWTHLTFVYSNGTLELRTRQNDLGWLYRGSIKNHPVSVNQNADGIVLGNSGRYTSTELFSGYVDEFRIFNRVLSEDEIAKNYNHRLNGSEDGLQVYYPLDEGLASQTVAYDFSRQNGVANNHHATATVAACSEENVVPSSEQMSLMTYTDKDGNYMLRGIPFSGEGTSYIISPTLGTHKFNPGNESRFFNLNSLTYSGVNFEDVSSFPVTGVVLYEGTSIPVADVTLKVDGITASRDGKAVTTNSKGEFRVDVPIGKHFISVEKVGHTFVDGGRYPEDPDGMGERELFDGEKPGMIFYDNTLVTVAGRVAGGDIENEKPLGLKQGNANLGQAVVTLEMENGDAGFLNATETTTGNAVSYNLNTVADRNFDAASGSARVPAGQNYIEVQTDPVTGEFVAQLPPIRYKVTGVNIPTNNINFTNLPVVDASNPNLVYTDSVETDKGVEKFEYVGSAKIKYKSPATFKVTENEDGSFGIKEYTLTEVDGTKHVVPIYEKKSDGTIDYKFGHPVYEEMSTHVFHISASELYENKDGGETIVDEVPLAGKKVTVQNPFATGAKIVCTNGNSTHPRGSVYEMENNTFELDSLGLAEYEFTVGYPNIQEPYTRGLTITYNNNGAEQDWEGNAYQGNENPFQAIILGALPTGNNFVTQGPDHIAMVLRDPPGTGSSATWKQGSTITTSSTSSVSIHSDTSLGTKIYAGVETGTAEGIGFMVIQNLESKATISIGAELNQEFTKQSNKTTTITATRDISTSDGFDYNGADGDLFIGSAKNIIFGTCHYVDIVWDRTEGANGAPKLTMADGIATGEEFTTGFNYTQNYVKNILIPNFITLRNNLLTRVNDVNSVNRPETGDPIYVTVLDENDPKFGTSNNDSTTWGNDAVSFKSLNTSTGRYTGPSYTMILPANWNKDVNGIQDMVTFYNVQIAKWEKELYLNEKAKVTAIQNSKDWLLENHSFDSGASISVEKTVEESESNTRTDNYEINAILGLETGLTICGVGVGVELTEKVGTTLNDENQTSTTTSSTFGYSLVEDGDDDYLTVDVFNAPDGYGPIFYTRGGATSCPYQDEVVTEYYEPGTIIMQKTVQIEKPEIEAQSQSITGIPAGGVGTLKVNIRNNSDTSEDGWYDIIVVSSSNPDGLAVSMDDTSLNYGTTVLVKAGETMQKTITVSQTNPDVLTYENVQIRIASQCQKDNTGVYPEIASYTSFNAYFQPACSDVHLAANHSIVNTNTKTDLVLSISGYNYPMETLKGIRLQYKGKNDANYTTLHEYIKGYKGNESGKSALPALTGTSTLDYNIDLRSDDFTDKTYVFRAVTVCEIGAEVNNESEEVEVIRDMSIPQLIATPTPASGVLGIGDDLSITFNEDIQGSILTKLNNFDVMGVLNETEVAHEVALSLTGENSAKTNTTMDLTDKSFSTSMWVNYSTDGTLWMHGTPDRNFKIAIEGGKLAVSNGDKKVTSTQTLPTGDWMYLNVSYDAKNSTVDAGYAMDASTVALLANAEIGAYDGNGPVSLGGNNLTAKVQELAIWNSARSMAEAQASMYTTKSQYTSGLMGYWQLNEGHGDVATDKARSRNLTLPSQNSWWIAGDNYALVLDGTKAAAANIGTLNTTSNDDYLVEAWFKADKTQNGVASILSTQVMDLRLNAEGALELELTKGSGEPTLYPLNIQLNDGEWHHVAVNVLKGTNGSGIIYIDGQQRKQIGAAAMPALYGEKLMLGSHRTSVDGQGLYTYDQMLKGAIDEVRIWKARRTADVIKNNMYNRVKADEAGLIGYYPMERLGLDSHHQVVTTSNLEDATESQAGELSFLTEGGSDTTGTTNSDNTAALKLAPSMTNVGFDFVASERQIKVNLTEQPYKMEGCNIYITAKYVKDAYGNSSEPITWSVYVQQNNLRWQENNLSVTKTGAEEQTFTATIENRGAQSENWSLSGLPSWLSANVESGILTPLATQKLTFTVDGSLPIGTYETTVYLTGSQNINAPLNITVDAEGDAPNWVATPGECTMTVIGQLKIDNVLSNDPKDMVAAFRGTVCVGVAQPKYFSRYDAYFVMMNVYGKENADLIYKAYDASTGTIYPSVNVSDESANTFVAEKAIGSFAAPVIFNPLDEIEQDLSLDRTGWKWFSLFVTPKDTDVSVVFKDATSAINAVTNGGSAVINWVGTLALDNPATMYKLNATEPYVESIIGKPTNPAEIGITLAGNGWTWIGYPVQAMNSLDAAFASANPQQGDLVKNQNSFSYYTGEEWIGTLTTMVPGDGYLYNSVASAAKTFNYPNPTVSGKKNAPRRPQFTALRSHFRDNMTMVAVVMNGDEIVENAQVSVYANGELCGFSGKPVSDSKHFLTIGGENPDMLTFVVTLSDGKEFVFATSKLFEANAMLGSLDKPVVLQLLNEATGIEDTEFVIRNSQPVYDLQGRKVQDVHKKGVYINQHKKVVIK